MPWVIEGAESGTHVSGAAGNCWSARSMGRLIPVLLESEKSLLSPCVRGKLEHLTSVKCRDQEIPLHPTTMQVLCIKNHKNPKSFPAASGGTLSTSASLPRLLLVLSSVIEQRLVKQHSQTKVASSKGNES